MGFTVLLVQGKDQGAALLSDTVAHRGAPGGVGATKCAGNYAAVLEAQRRAKLSSFTDVLVLDCSSGQHLEEASTGNIFIVSGKQVKTPGLKGTFLEGVTRRSILQLLRDEGYVATEDDVSVADAMEADEMFISGTAAGVCFCRSLAFEGAQADSMYILRSTISDEIQSQADRKEGSQAQHTGYYDTLAKLTS